MFKTFFAPYCFAALAAFSASAPALAQSALPTPPGSALGSDLAPAPRWAELTPAQREALAPLSARFDGLDGGQRRKWRALANRYPSLSPDKQKIAQSRMLAWASMSPEQRAAARQQALAARAAGAPADKRAQSWRHWRDLQDGERERLQEKAVKASPMASPAQR